MTKTEGQNTVVALAKKELGYREGENNWTKYAADPLIARLYGWTPQNQPWCATFINWCYLQAFGWDIGSKILYGGSAACSVAAENFKKNGAFVRSPQIGDQAFYYSGSGINHTGMVVEVTGNSFTAIEGNYSDKVSNVRHQTTAKEVAGFGRPNWGLVQGSELTDDKETVSTGNGQNLNLKAHKLTLPLLQYGSTGEAVKLAQQLLKMRDFPCGQVDGDFGTLTMGAVYDFQQWAFPKEKSEWDKKLGPKSWAKLMATQQEES